MTKRSVPTCVCDSVYGHSHAECELSSGYLCEILKNAGEQSTFLSNGTVIDEAEAVSLVGRSLRDASYPLITGLENVGVESQKAAANVARAAKGVVDSSWTDSAFPWILSMARAGMVTSSIGEVALRSDVLVVIDGDPWQTHPRLASQFSGSEKTLVYLGTKGKMNASIPWTSTLFTDEEGLEPLLIQLEMSLTSRSANSKCFDNLNDEQNSLVRLFLDSRYVTFFAWDSLHGLAGPGNFHSAVDSLVSFAARLNQTTRSVVLKLQVGRNDHGAENVSTWNFGFPRAVDMTQGSARSFGDEYSTSNIVKRRECDLLLNFGEVPMDRLDQATVEHLRSIPIISFVWSGQNAWPPDHAKPETLIEIKNLALLPDDFIRFDDASIELDISSPTLPSPPQLREFLDHVAKRATL